MTALELAILMMGDDHSVYPSLGEDGVWRYVVQWKENDKTVRDGGGWKRTVEEAVLTWVGGLERTSMIWVRVAPWGGWENMLRVAPGIVWAFAKVGNPNDAGIGQ